MNGRLWLTRTAPLREVGLAQALQAQGWTVDSLPLLAIEPLPWSAAELTARRAQVHAAAHLLWTSAAAVESSRRLWPASAPQATCHAVGQRTAAVLAQTWALQVHVPSAGHGAARWAHEHARHWPRGARCVVLTGEGGQQDWQTASELHHVEWQTLALYRRSPLPCPLPSQDPDAVLATSAAALSALDAQIRAADRPQLQRLPLILPAPRLLRTAQSEGWSGRMVIVPDLTPAAVLKALQEIR